MDSKTKKITTFVVSAVALIATVVTLLIGAPAHSKGETVETTNSVATTTEAMTTQTMTETTTLTTETTTTITEITTTKTTSKITEVVTTKQTTTFIIETQKPTTEAVLITTEALVTNETKETTITENVETIVVKKTNEEIAEEVINGLWGNGQDRKKKLTEYGYDYNSIQKIVDELMRNNFSNQDDKNTSISDYVHIGEMRITGYVATGNKTASGVYPYVGGVAMNNAQRKELGIEWGDKIFIKGLGTYVVFDCGCKRNVVDVFCDTVSECYALTSHADVYIIK